MRFLCATCDQLSELSDARVEDGILYATCETCAAESRAYVSVSEPFLKSAANAQGLRTSGSRPLLTLVRNEPQGPRDELSIPPGCCPKCIAPRLPGSSACSKCGLVDGNFRAQSFELSPALKASWAKVLAGYENLRNHERFVAAAFQTGELALAGRLYRIRLARDPADPFARHGRLEVLRRAAAAGTVLTKQKEPFLSWHVSRSLKVMAPLFPLLGLLYLLLTHMR